MEADLVSEIGRTIGVLRAENYSRGGLFEALETPAYWARLTGNRVCFIFGGRGTGKTTALRALSYEGQLALKGADITTWDAVGFYWRVETSVVTAFDGPRLDEVAWARLFAHYINLRLLLNVSDFVARIRNERMAPIHFDADKLRLAAASLNLSEEGGIDEFISQTRLALARFEARLNTLTSQSQVLDLSILGKPVEHFLDALRADSYLKTVPFLFAIDEYENLLPYQQRVVNTLVKHSGDQGYTFKIGVKRGGVHDRATLNPREVLSEPADYLAIDVEDELRREGFSEFAERVCEDRLRRIHGVPAEFRMRDILPDFSIEQELTWLGGERLRGEIGSELLRDGATVEEISSFEALPLADACLIGYWSSSGNRSLRDTLKEARDDPRKWANRVNNYGYAMLFTIRGRRPGVRKYYGGWGVFTHIADGNIRHLLSLVSEALVRHVEQGFTLDVPVGPDTQTEAAEMVGQRLVFELAGLHARGTELMRFVLSMGRVLSVMAAYPQGHTPEVTQFRVDWGSDRDEELHALLSIGVMHDALKRFPGDKNSARAGDIKEYDYYLHPIYAAFFCYSYRRKRRMSLMSSDLLSMSLPSPQRAIAKILRRNSRNANVALPDQLEVLADFFLD